jgi:hypothetical protein
MITGGCFLCPRRAGASDEFEVEFAPVEEVTNSLCGFSSQLSLNFASGTTRLWRIEAYEPHVRLHLKHLNRIAVDNADIRLVN